MSQDNNRPLHLLRSFRMSNLCAERISNDVELHVCSSELDVPEHGLAIIAEANLTTVVRSDGSIVMKAERGFSGECCAYVRDGEFLGDLQSLEMTSLGDKPFTEVMYERVPTRE